MQKLGVLVRSKIPVFGAGNIQNEGTILLAPISSENKQNENYNTNANFYNNEDGVTSNKFESQQQTGSISQCTSDNDLYDYNDKSNANRINEWQAGYNVTNAIQVSFIGFL